MHILGISAYYHDSAAALLSDGEITAAAQEERFTRKKHDSAFPARAIEYCLKEANIALSDVEMICFYDKPFIKFERILETYLSFAPRGIGSFVRAMPVWLKDKLFLKATLRKELSKLSGLKVAELPKLLFAEHHQSHAASAFFPSPFEKAAVLCMDGVGEWATTSTWIGEGNVLKPVWEIDFPHSLGLLYTAFTYYTGFKVNSGEYKVMGLAPYGEPKYAGLIREKLIDIKDDGTFRLNMEYFNFATGLTMTNSKFDELFGAPPRKSEAEITQREMDLAASIQVVTEEIVLKLGKSLKSETGMRNLCMAGGVALNCVANGKLLRERVFDQIWVQPAAGDAGGALGCAYSAWYEFKKNPRHINGSGQDQMKGSSLGPSYSESEVEKILGEMGVPYQSYSGEELFDSVAALLAEGNVIGWFQGRMEFGPRALGNRSIIGDPRNQEMQTNMNLKIKYRESFRPFAPAVLYDEVAEYFEIDQRSPYMLLVAPVQKSIRKDAEDRGLFGIEKLKQQRSSIPAVTHVDYSARVQTVEDESNPRFYRLLRSFKKKTGCPVLVNTSFNVRGEPIVCTVEDAFRCFMGTEMDYLVVENCVLDKKKQAKTDKEKYWKDQFELD